MIVYRLCTYDEAKEILATESFNTVGKPGKEFVNIQQQKNISNHIYNYHKNYLHFYADKASIFYLNVDNNCICTYNIPDDILAKRLGEGYYLDLANQRRIVKVPEYAIDVDELQFDYLETVEYAREYVDVDDFFVDSTLKDHVEPIYNKEKGIIRERRVS